MGNFHVMHRGILYDIHKSPDSIITADACTEEKKKYLTNIFYYVKIILFSQFIIMKHTKHISIALVGAALLFSGNISAQAQTLTPSLYKQMQQQNIINEQYERTKFDRLNEERMEEIRQRTQARMQNLSPENTTTHGSAPLETPAIDNAAREHALARTVTRKNTPLGMTSTPQTITIDTPSTSSAPRTHGARNLGTIDMRTVENAWLSWNNGLRSELGLAPYSIHDALNATAQEWSEFSKNRGYITHGRPGDGCVGAKNYSCYNFKVIDQWFQDRGVNPKVIARSKHTENVGIGAFRCQSGDCTQAAINAIKKTYNFFHSEKSYNGVHYRSMVSPHFRHIGVGLDHHNGTYYLTVHYATEL